MSYTKTKVNKNIKYKKAKIYALIIFLVIILTTILVFKTNIFLINDIIVTNNYQISDEIVISYSGIHLNDNIFKINLSESQEKVEKNPYIKKAIIKRHLPNRIQIDIEERKMLAAIENMGIYFLVDDEGYLLETNPEVNDSYIVKGFEFDSFLQGDKLKIKNQDDFDSILILCKLLKKSDFISKPIIYYNDGTIEMDIDNQLKVKLGESEDLEIKLKKLNIIIKDLVNRNSQHGELDMSNDGQIIYRPFRE